MDMTPKSRFSLFPVSTAKFIVLSLVSFGIYEIYWCYDNWKRLAARPDHPPVSAFWRAFLAPFWAFALFREIQDMAVARGIAATWSAPFLGLSYLVLSLVALLPDPWWLVCIASFVPMIPVQRTAQQINDLEADAVEEGENDGYSGWNIAAMVGGVLLLLLVLVALFVVTPEG